MIMGLGHSSSGNRLGNFRNAAAPVLVTARRGVDCFGAVQGRGQ